MEIISTKKTPEEILEMCCEEFQITKSFVCGDHRYREGAEVRAAAYFLVRLIHPSIGLKRIASVTIGRDQDHSTVSTAITKCSILMGIDVLYKDHMRNLAKKLAIVL